MKRTKIQKILFLLLIPTFIMFSISCRKNGDVSVKKPAQLIEKSKLSKVLTEAYIIESVIYFKAQKGVDYTLYTTVYYNALFKKYGITKKQYNESLKYYIETDKNVSELFLYAINKLMALQDAPIISSSQNSNGDNNSNSNMPGSPFRKTTSDTLQ
jgi:hypothetical protein